MTPATEKPVRRTVDGGSLGTLVIEVTKRTVRVRPLWSRHTAAVVEIPWGALYTHGLIVQDNARRRARRRPA